MIPKSIKEKGAAPPFLLSGCDFKARVIFGHFISQKISITSAARAESTNTALQPLRVIKRGAVRYTATVPKLLPQETSTTAFL